MSFILSMCHSSLYLLKFFHFLTIQGIIPFHYPLTKVATERASIGLVPRGSDGANYRPLIAFTKHAVR